MLILSCGGKLGFLSSCYRYLREPLELHKRSYIYFNFEMELGIAVKRCMDIQASSCFEGVNLVVFRVAEGSSGFLSSFNGTSGNLFVLTQESQTSFQLQGAPRDTSRVAAGNMASFGDKTETQSSSRSSTGISGFLSSFNRRFSPCLMLRHDASFSLEL